MYRFLLSLRWLRLLAGAIAVAVGCVALGSWQLDRLEQRHQRNSVIEHSVAAPAAAAADVLAVGRAPASTDQWRRVTATGRYDVNHQLLVRNRPFDGNVGFYVLTPLVTDSGPALLVNRGWVRAGQSAREVPDVPDPPAGTVTVTARLRLSEPAPTGAAPPRGQVTRINVDAIAGDLPYDVYGAFAERIRESPAPRTRPEALPEPEPSEGPHLAYAVQWFLFAVLALFGFVLLARREATDATTRAGGEGPQEPGAPAPSDTPSVRTARAPPA